MRIVGGHVQTEYASCLQKAGSKRGDTVNNISWHTYGTYETRRFSVQCVMKCSRP